MRARTTTSEIELLREKRKNMVARANERFASAARRAGLAELDISDAELNEVLAEITERFRDGEKRKTGTST
ncbi:TraC family protein [Rhizobium sp. CNPSo 4062]|uniref:TraC family protein n=1 Tax=Rhizobium sp. CNPSo 4062 TaxID=3021410 RepID=UPI00254D404B|nr:TraC family protein [Rhizobium sp. CNPSo 4062]MDK4706465.1 TraC family protein [Rhizobium sp. CNPSo 4062]